MSNEVTEDRPARTERIFYVRTQSGQPIATVAYQMDQDTGVTRYAVSTLHPSDKFDRVLGRRIALGRLRQCAYTLKGAQERPLARVLVDISGNADVPLRVRKRLRQFHVEGR